MQGKEIVIVTISLGNDGAERVLTELSNEWVSTGNKVTIIQTGHGYGCSYELSNLVEIVNIRVKYKSKLGRYIKEIIALRNELKKRPNATALSFIASSMFILAMCKPFIKNKIVVSERNDPKKCPKGKIQQFLRNFSFSLADACVFQTEEAKGMFSKRVQKKGYIILNPINGDLPLRYEGERRKAIVTACRLHPQKNLPMLIKAFYQLSMDFPEYSLKIYGQGEEREKLEQLIDTLHIQDKVSMPGFVDNVHEKMVDASMYVSSSDYEGISNSMLEALGMGIPTVVTDCPVGGARMVIRNGENGLLVPTGDVDALYHAMKNVIDDKSLAEKLSLNAYEIRKEYPVSKIAKKWLELL